jgi:hypothetical protein
MRNLALSYASCHQLGRAHPTTRTVRKNYAALLRTIGCEEDAKHLEAEP